MRDLSIYIHIPFCLRKCLYCDFLSFPLAGDLSYVNQQFQDISSVCSLQEIEDYVNLLLHEIESQSVNYHNHQVITIFLGGGTPSLLTGEQVGAILGQIRRNYTVVEMPETTIEMNPGTVTRVKLEAYRKAGVNRISIGLQSADDKELARIGRIHDYNAFLTTYHLARETGFQNINIDLMAALPGQDADSYKETLRKTVALAPEHISAYSLILEEGTWMYEHRGMYCFPSEDEDREMYLYTGAYLGKYGYSRYEISNYAKKGYECRHNKVYWQRGDYVGFGLGAASMVENIRWSSPTALDGYEMYIRNMSRTMAKEKPIAAADREDVQPVRHSLTVSEQMEEFMFLGLRLTDGVDRNVFQRTFGKPIEEVYGEMLERFYGQKLLVKEGDHIRLTARGIDVSNYVMAQFLFE